MADHTAPGARILAAWQRLSPLPGGKWLFSRFLGRLAPYTGSMGAHCHELRPGHARWVLHDRPHVRNHLRSIHAIALVNLAEVASGTAMLTALPPGVRGIVTRIEIDYLKKARGTLTAESNPVVAPVREPRDQQVEARVTDAAGDVVAVARVTWRLAPAEGGRA